ncbi:hypothetical protein [Litoreibacter roseus]|uniref:Uncharacterized protein n=1 Tax=Litoreibacter roseus TaxID=2601869 RepID=A0A6N6JGS9_9RHOB|nr:hypothetical protein [Litoreibacter roseus]GFE65553.1 hypothetical protein KIN_26270 [Litoreibacter roseus]
MKNEAAIELFRENMSDIGQLGPVSLFLDNATSLTDPTLDGHNPAALNDYAKIQTAQNKAQALDTHHGVISGSKDGIRGGIAERVADARGGKIAQSEREDRRAADSAFYVLLLAEGGVGSFIAGKYFEGMSDEEALDFSRRLEEETGMSLEQWAGDILGPEVAAKLPSETDAEYIKRVGKDVLEAITDDEGKLLPEYADSAIGNFFQGEYEYQRILGSVMPQIEAARASGMTVPQAEAKLRAEGVMDGGLKVEFAAAAAAESDDQALYVALEDDRELGREVDLGTTADVAANNTALNMFS